MEFLIIRYFRTFTLCSSIIFSFINEFNDLDLKNYVLFIHIYIVPSNVICINRLGNSNNFSSIFTL
jgi:hypothetical protein